MTNMEQFDELVELMNRKHGSVKSRSTCRNATVIIRSQGSCSGDNVWYKRIEKIIGHQMNELILRRRDTISLMKDMNYYSPSDFNNIRSICFKKIGQKENQTLDGNELAGKLASRSGCIGVVRNCSGSLLDNNKKKGFCVMELVKNMDSKREQFVSIFLWDNPFSKYCGNVKTGDVILVTGSPLLTTRKELKKKRKGARFNLHVYEENQVVLVGRVRKNSCVAVGKKG